MKFVLTKRGVGKVDDPLILVGGCHCGWWCCYNGGCARSGNCCSGCWCGGALDAVGAETVVMAGAVVVKTV